MAAVNVWWATPTAPSDDERLLTPLERARLGALHHPADRNRFLSAHVLARRSVAELLDIDAATVAIGASCGRCGGPHGQPRVVEPAGTGLHLSLTHAGERAVVAVASRPVGIDVEPLGSPHPGVEQVALAPRERRHLDGLPGDARTDVLIRWWVRKESVVKATGHGVTLDLRSVEVSAPPAPPRVVRWPGAPGLVRLAEVDVGPDHCATVALVGHRRPVVEARHVDLSEWR